MSMDKDLRKLLKQLEPHGFTVEHTRSHAVLVAPTGARTHLPTGNNNRMATVLVRKFAKRNGVII